MGLFHSSKALSVATIHDGALILSLTDAKEPCVWRMDLTQARLSALELKDDNGAALLQIRTPKGDIHTIATYDQRDRALEVLTTVAATLSGAKTHSNTNTTTASTPTNSNWLWFGVALVGLLIVFSFMSATKTSSYKLNIPSKTTTGEPLSADDFLNR